MFTAKVAAPILTLNTCRGVSWRKNISFEVSKRNFQFDITFAAKTAKLYVFCTFIGNTKVVKIGIKIVE